MFKHLCISTIMAGSFILTPALAENNKIQNNALSSQQNILLAENDSDRTSKDSSSRGSVTQGVIGAEAKENRQLVPEESAAEKREQDPSPNIRLPDDKQDNVDSIPPAAE
ncbi:hypothetical protein E8Q33_04995 [Methylophaga sp. SB9B]|uniref:hypothetical protein n=1 Tax=Methylophaga sp. SB9B TaxID=2570356 RepID=UPI0010A750C0|nr:hypothetical protein [Methylophaga sp. SB9B]THK42143.1 hypothetical protein E8Q33_04995 [Methylophaga sp. SB9B]